MPGFLIGPGGARMQVAVTRPRHRAAALCAALGSRGFVPVIRSLVRVEPCSGALTEMMQAIVEGASRHRPQWVVLTSVEAVRALNAARRGLNLEWPSIHVACVGPATAAAAARVHLDVTFVPSEWNANALAAGLPEITSGAARLLDQFLTSAITAGASDLHLEPGPSSVAVRRRPMSGWRP